MIIAVDLDGTIIEEKPTFQRCLAKPLDDAIEILKQLKSEGHTIVIYTARSHFEYDMTVEQLNRLGIPYDRIIMGKFPADYYIDDRSFKSLRNFTLKDNKISLSEITDAFNISYNAHNDKP